MEASLQSVSANSKIAYCYWSSSEDKIVGQSKHAASQLESMRVRAAERASEVEMVS
jgi:hypothetical protein